MSAPQEPSQPRAVETPLPFVQADPPPHDLELGVTTSDDGQWGTSTPSRTTVTRTGFAQMLTFAGLAQLRYTIIRHGWHRKR